jgi:hypothetical protein
MFVPVADMTCLRQGDILDGVPFPRLSSAETRVLGRLPVDLSQPTVPQLPAHTDTHRDDPRWLVAQVPVRLSYCAVISQCCDLEPRNQRITLPAFALARLIPIPAQIMEDAQRFSSLKSNKDPRVGSDPGYVNLFYVPALPELNGKEWIVDFNQTVSIPGKEFPSILRSKKLQMEDDWRVKFKIKLATCLARLTDEERAAGLEQPWVGKQKPMEFPPNK